MDNIKQLSKGRTGKMLLETLAEVKSKIADIRNPVPVKSEMENEVRLAVIDVIDKFLVEPLRIQGQHVVPPEEGEFF